MNIPCCNQTAGNYGYPSQGWVDPFTSPTYQYAYPLNPYCEHYYTSGKLNCSSTFGCHGPTTADASYYTHSIGMVPPGYASPHFTISDLWYMDHNIRDKKTNKRILCDNLSWGKSSIYGECFECAGFLMGEPIAECCGSVVC